MFNFVGNIYESPLSSIKIQKKHRKAAQRKKRVLYSLCKDNVRHLWTHHPSMMFQI